MNTWIKAWLETLQVNDFSLCDGKLWELLFNIDDVPKMEKRKSLQMIYVQVRALSSSY